MTRLEMPITIFVKGTTATTTTQTSEALFAFSCIQLIQWSFLATSTTAHVCPSQDILARWRSDSNLSDDAGLHGGAKSISAPTLTNGYHSNAASFVAASRQSVTVSILPSSFQSFSVNAWIFATGYRNSLDHSIVGMCQAMRCGECLHLNIRNNKL